MVEWYWLLIVAWISGSLGLLIAAICLSAKRSDNFQDR
jgi:hypothetical protein